MTPQSDPELDRLVGYAIRYFHDFIRPAKTFRPPNDIERAALEELDAELGKLDGSQDGETIQNVVYAVGKVHSFENLRDWFKGIYQVLLGQDQGPRFGSFIALYGIEETRALIKKGLSGELTASAKETA